MSVESKETRSTAADIARFRRQLEEEAHGISQNGPAARRAEIKASGDFHPIPASLSGNDILKRFMEELVARYSLVIALYGRSGASSCGHDHHTELLDALAKGDEILAQDVMLRHIAHLEADLDLRTREPMSLRDALFLR
ncbi:GntR family transcriptional regulator [Pseudorhizobium endolithicum]|uniref:GntR family transcriptional regulator n=1 Tax=Pseudorhizobium endolithicum TaxID=1191678 RepID=A0ABN7JV82_9HYPH|nr:GntR family transcriptional regulator [Rhizobium sp. Q54]CAD7049791.1 GntR family transcriptional regulator [Pseudorhizobium endolithicum]